MASNTDQTSPDMGVHEEFVLLEETELHLPDAGDVVVVADAASGSFWQAEAGTGGKTLLPALDELITDPAGHESSAAFTLLQTAGGAALAEPCLLDAVDGLCGATAPSLVHIIVDDGSNGPFVA